MRFYYRIFVHPVKQIKTDVSTIIKTIKEDIDINKVEKLLNNNNIDKTTKIIKIITKSGEEAVDNKNTSICNINKKRCNDTNETSDSKKRKYSKKEKPLKFIDLTESINNNYDIKMNSKEKDSNHVKMTLVSRKSSDSSSKNKIDIKINEPSSDFKRLRSNDFYSSNNESSKSNNKSDSVMDVEQEKVRKPHSSKTSTKNNCDDEVFIMSSSSKNESKKHKEITKYDFVDECDEKEREKIGQNNSYKLIGETPYKKCYGHIKRNVSSTHDSRPIEIDTSNSPFMVYKNKKSEFTNVPRVKIHLASATVPKQHTNKEELTKPKIDIPKTQDRPIDLEEYASYIGLKPIIQAIDTKSMEKKNGESSRSSSSNSSHKKRKKDKHSKESGSKRRKHHAEISSHDDENLKLKVKLTDKPSKHDRKSSSSEEKERDKEKEKEKEREKEKEKEKKKESDKEKEKEKEQEKQKQNLIAKKDESSQQKLNEIRSVRKPMVDIPNIRKDLLDEDCLIEILKDPLRIDFDDKFEDDIPIPKTIISKSNPQNVSTMAAPSTSNDIKMASPSTYKPVPIKNVQPQMNFFGTPRHTPSYNFTLPSTPSTSKRLSASPPSFSTYMPGLKNINSVFKRSYSVDSRADNKIKTNFPPAFPAPISSKSVNDRRPYYTSPIGSNHIHENHTVKPPPIVLPPSSISVHKMLNSRSISVDNKKSLEILPISSNVPGIDQKQLVKPKTNRPPPSTIPLFKIKNSSTTTTASSFLNKRIPKIGQPPPPQLNKIDLTKTSNRFVSDKHKNGDKPKSMCDNVGALDLSGKSNRIDDKTPEKLSPKDVKPSGSEPKIKENTPKTVTTKFVNKNYPPLSNTFVSSSSSKQEAKINGNGTDKKSEVNPNIKKMPDLLIGRTKLMPPLTPTAVTQPRQLPLPKLNEITKVRTVNTVRQQNPSVRNIPNPSALAFRNQANPINPVKSTTITLPPATLIKQIEGTSISSSNISGSTNTVTSSVPIVATTTTSTSSTVKTNFPLPTNKNEKEKVTSDLIAKKNLHIEKVAASLRLAAGDTSTSSNLV